ncbi:hypothetical protein, partial [Pseudomonas aeruginosa]
MKFVDEVSIHVKAGDGGNGLMSFRREKFLSLIHISEPTRP